ncbi:unnamed protein product [Rotaria magnacalcarata]|uniref:Uncharacterized protein n=4 Tax=Rotaria magnacalcarata TaxID=392030 RepID=A0A819V6I8_9BILA|nr:unnamed protein product [Rotaria magnacalcarata]CAF4104307.1 unnamed protein product [Rotaria magnacalcarata]
MGQYAYAFAQSFLVLYNLETDNVSIQLGNLTWPDSSFLPRAVDINQDLLVVVLGYVGNSSSKFTPCAYLLSRSGSNWTVTDTWAYMPPSTSWQAILTNWDANTYSAKYDMSVSFNDVNSQVLLGIQIANTFVLLNIDQASKTFLLPSQSLSNGKAIGTGKTVGWLNSDVALILVNTYSLNYIWSSSQIFTYNWSVNNSFAIVSIIPNSQQLLSPEFGPVLLALVATPSGIIIMLDSSGNLYILRQSPPGSYSDSSTKSVSSFLPCIGGTYSSQFDIQPCSLCPQGFSTYGLTGQSSCVSCETDAFCPLGSAFGHISSSSSFLTSINQARAYPLSPTSTRFENILMQNTFAISVTSSTTCLLMSPLFWASMIMLLGVAIAVLIIILKYFVTNPRGKKAQQRLEHFFKQTDIIGEGEFWIGGIVSFAIIFICICGYVFSGTYYKRYPIENTSDSTVFGCNPTLTNAQFTSGLMSIMVSPNDDESRIFELLDAQIFILHVDFVNTLYACTDLTLAQIKDKTLPLAYSSCSNNNGSLSLVVQLPSHGVNLQFLLAGINTIGGIRLYLEGSGTEEENDTLEARYTLVDLMFAQVFTFAGRVLIEQPSFTMQLTKVINRTSPLQENEEKVLSAFWLPYVSADINQIFADESEYIYATSSNAIMSLTISEGAFYVLNTQQPIVDEAELIFTDMLFTITCIEIFGFIFLIFKLLIIPFTKCLLKCYSWHTASDKLPIANDERKMSAVRFLNF